MLRERETSKQKEYEIVLLDELVPQDHILRKIDAAVDFSFIHDLCKDLYSPNMGRPAIEPELLFRMLFLGYLVIESYIKRLKDMENIAQSYNGVTKTYAIQAGRELRVIVGADQVSDQDAETLSTEIAKKIQEEMVYPGQVKITVIRETRSVAFAK